MRMIYVVPKGIDLGGIITSSENLVAAAKELGIDVRFRYLSATANSNKSAPSNENGYEYSSATEMWVHPIKGWKGPHIVDLESPRSLSAFVHDCNHADVVVWGALYGLSNATYEKNPHYIRNLFDNLTSKQVAFVRDDHMFKRHPWVAEIVDKISLWACVQQISYDSIPADFPKIIVSSGHDLSTKNIVPWKEKFDRICMIQTFKPWKKAEELVRKVPEISNLGWSVVLAGDGIARRYMASPDKCPDKFKDSFNVPIWQKAVHAGMTWWPSLTAAERDTALENSKFLVDMSEKGSGGQINRIVIEAMLKGVIPICKESFVSGTGMMPWLNYIPVTADTLVRRVTKTDDAICESIRKNNERYVLNHDRKATITSILERI